MDQSLDSLVTLKIKVMNCFRCNMWLIYMLGELLCLVIFVSKFCLLNNSYLELSLKRWYEPYFKDLDKDIEMIQYKISKYSDNILVYTEYRV